MSAASTGETSRGKMAGGVIELIKCDYIKIPRLYYDHKFLWGILQVQGCIIEPSEYGQVFLKSQITIKPLIIQFLLLQAFQHPRQCQKEAHCIAFVVPYGYSRAAGATAAGCS